MRHKQPNLRYNQEGFDRVKTSLGVVLSHDILRELGIDPYWNYPLNYPGATVPGRPKQ